MKIVIIGILLLTCVFSYIAATNDRGVTDNSSKEIPCVRNAKELKEACND
ncbi:hypothetical protein KAR91_84560 [Candidatus Pacearchaeota archaeon]|nr:hypothetical protein [Candidatus Pacearchaeota archaeon]